jgi:hypothetical protein
MEADWELEIGGNAPIIEAHWPGFVNLRDEPERISEIAETKELPGLVEVLARLNSKHSPVWTAKCDVFDPGEIDPDELSSTSEEATFAISSYIDVLMRSDCVWNSPLEAERTCRSICARLQEIPMRGCRVDIVVREARIRDINILGATVYSTGCGRAHQEAKDRLRGCMSALAEVMMLCCALGATHEGA